MSERLKEDCCTIIAHNGVTGVHCLLKRREDLDHSTIRSRESMGS